LLRESLAGHESMKRYRVTPILCVLILFSIAISGCTVSFNPPNVQFIPSQFPSGINSSVTSNGTAHMLAVEQVDDSDQYRGAISEVKVFSRVGTGHVFVETAPLTGVDFQTTARDVIKVAAKMAQLDPKQRDFEFVLTVPAGVEAVDGPSAGLPMTIAAYAAMTNKSANVSVYGTGAIDSNGTVSGVSGVYLKAQAAAQAGARVIIVPSGQTIVSTSSPLATDVVGGVNLQTQLQKEGYNVTVVGVKTVNDALLYYFR
jgi:predicted S18 family serine protease